MASKSGFLLRAAARRSRRQAQLTHCQTESLHGTGTSEQSATAAQVLEGPAESGDLHPSQVTPEATTAKSMMDLPGPYGWPVIGNFLTYLRKENHGKIHIVQANYHKKFGPIFREKWGPKWQVHISDPSLIEYVYRNQGRFPNRPGIQAWNLYRDINNIPEGLFTSQGEKWYETRSLLDKKLLNPSECIKFFEPLSEVTTDLVSRIEHIRDTDGDVTLARCLPNELYKWGVECAGVLLFDRRLGCIDNNINPEAQRFVDAFTDMFDTSMKLIVGEKLQQKLNTKTWNKHTEAWNDIFSTAKKYIQQRMDMLEAQKTANPSHSSGCPFQKGIGTGSKPSYLGDVLASGKLSLPEVFSNFSEIMIGGSDTTSNTMCFLLHQLAQNPEVQARLQAEIYTVTAEIDDKESPVGKMPYLDAVLKETMRMFPLATLQCRILDTDITVGGYKIPKDTLFVLNHYATCRNPEVFSDPDDFKPERWMRDGSSRIKHHPFASMPFGYGKRICLGKRFARLELHLAVSKLLQKFEVRPIEGMPFETEVRVIHTPGKQVPIRFVNR